MPMMFTNDTSNTNTLTGYLEKHRLGEFYLESLQVYEIMKITHLGTQNNKNGKFLFHKSHLSYHIYYIPFQSQQLNLRI